MGLVRNGAGELVTDNSLRDFSGDNFRIGDIAEGQSIKRQGESLIGYTPDVVDPILTTKGDLLGRSVSANTRIPIGSNDQVLTADSTVPLGVKWATPSGGGGLSGSPIQSVGTDAAISATIPVTRLNKSSAQAVTIPDPTTNGFRKTIRNGGDDGGEIARTITAATANHIQETDSAIISIVLTGENASVTLIGDLVTLSPLAVWRVESVSVGTSAGGNPGSVVINYAG